MAIKYSKAPIAELSLGIFFKSNLLWKNNVLFDLILDLSKNYPIVQTTPAIPIDEITDRNIGYIQDVNNAGFIAHLLTSSDYLYKITLLQNAIILSWNRRADMPNISAYPGFSSIYEKFLDIYSRTLAISSSRKVDLLSDIRLYSLTYQDRTSLNIYRENGFCLKDIIKISSPEILFENNKYHAENYISKFSIDLPYLNGYSIIDVNTPTYPGSGQMLILENKIKGYLSDMNNWFEMAHQSQTSFFENIFSETILKDWE